MRAGGRVLVPDKFIQDIILIMMLVDHKFMINGIFNLRMINDIFNLRKKSYVLDLGKV